jgi:hypothetical protein
MQRMRQTLNRLGFGLPLIPWHEPCHWTTILSWLEVKALSGCAALESPNGYFTAIERIGSSTAQLFRFRAVLISSAAPASCESSSPAE